MKQIFFSVLCVLALTFVMTGAVRAHDYKTDTLEIAHPSVYAVDADADSAIGVLRIENSSKDSDRLIGISAPEISDAVQIVLLPPDGGPKMVVDALDIPADQDTVLAPSGNHIAFQAPKRALVPDDSFAAVLRFEKAGDVPVIFHVDGPMHGIR